MHEFIPVLPHCRDEGPETVNEDWAQVTGDRRRLVVVHVVCHGPIPAEVTK